MRRAGIKRGAFIVMNPQTGEVLALVSLPSYDNNLFARGISVKDYATLLEEQGPAADEPRGPGALPAGIDVQARRRAPAASPTARSRPQTRIQTRGYLTLAGARFYDWNRRGFGPAT